MRKRREPDLAVGDLQHQLVVHLQEHAAAQLGGDQAPVHAEHGDLDPGHRDHLDETLDSLPLTREHEAVMAISATATAAFVARAVEEVLR